LRFCVTTGVYLVLKIWSQVGSLASVYTASVEFPRPSKIERFVHNEEDRKTELLSLSLRYQDWIIIRSKWLKSSTWNEVKFAAYICFLDSTSSREGLLGNRQLVEKQNPKKSTTKFIVDKKFKIVKVWKELT